MMNKYLRLFLLTAFVGLTSWGLGSNFVFQKNVVNMRTMANEWKFQPENITISAGRVWTIKIYNEDPYPHGFYIKELGINQTLAPKKTTEIKINAKDPGEYYFFCSLICGAGHYRMTGVLKVFR